MDKNIEWLRVVEHGKDEKEGKILFSRSHRDKRVSEWLCSISIWLQRYVEFLNIFRTITALYGIITSISSGQTSK